MMKKIFNKFAYEEVHMIVSSILMIIPIAIISVGVYIPETPFMMYIITCWSFEPPVLHILYDYYKDKKNIISKSEKDGNKFRKKLLRRMRFEKNLNMIVKYVITTMMVCVVIVGLATAFLLCVKLLFIATELIF